MKMFFNEITALLEGPLSHSGENCSKRFKQQKTEDNSGAIGPLFI